VLRLSHWRAAAVRSWLDLERTFVFKKKRAGQWLARFALSAGLIENKPSFVLPKKYFGAVRVMFHIRHGHCMSYVRLATKSNVTNHAGIVHLRGAVAVYNFRPQIRQPHIGSETLNQILFSILTSASAFRARQPNNLAGIFAELLV
jgi:hypothetical protein